MRYVIPALLCMLVLATRLGAAAGTTSAGATSTFSSSPLGLTVVATEISLPPGRWQVSAVSPGGILDQVFIVPRASPEATPGGGRVQMASVARRIESARWPLQALFGACRDYAAAHGGNGPSALGDLDPRRYGALVKSLDRSPWPEDAKNGITGPFYFLVPDVPIPLGPGPHAGSESPLVLELRPYVDDGKHWVLLADGRVERHPIDPALVARHGLRMSFVQARATAERPSGNAVRAHRLLALRRDPRPAVLVLTLTERTAGALADIRWDLAVEQPAGPDLLAEWAEARARDWAPLLERSGSSVLDAWAARVAGLYGARPYPVHDARAPGAADRRADAFAILGGRAALRETLQMELLRPRRPAGPEPGTIPLSTLRGVEVKSHPFGEMLAGKEGGRLPLADHVPPDRLFVYFARPSAVFPLLDRGGDFLFRAGSLFTRSAVDDDLKGRYLRRLGLDEKLGRRLLESGEVTELALVAPDLFFIDGTDVTVLMRMRQPDRLLGRLKAFAGIELGREGITERTLPSGRRTAWARQGDLLALGTSRAELEAVLALGARQGAGSLGRSVEFRYMLTELPLRRETRALVYLSDPFIRRMVGPAVKIGQLRRMRARAEMEMITAGALLYLLDGHRDRPTIERLVALGYVPAGAGDGRYRLRGDLAAVSPRWGSPAEMAAIDAASIDTVTASEAEAYRRYVDEYARYWRQYFDPIAMRLDDGADGALELSTFISPLVDSQLYGQIRTFIAPREAGATLRVPAVAPDPVLLLSLNLTDDAWVKVSGSWSELFSRYTGISPAIFDGFGPGLHLAVQDADPIVVLGNADLLGSLGGPMLTANMMEGGLPLLLAVLTRPCKIMIELRDPQATLDILRRGTGGARPAPRGTMVEFRQVEGRDAWIYVLNIAGMVRMRFGIEVSGGYLVLSNIPWSQPVTVTAAAARALNGAELLITPGAVRQGLPGLFATQSEQNQLAALGGMAALYPLLLTVSATPDEAAARHAALFGSRPLHPGPGQWIWQEGRLGSSAYGTPTSWREPPYRPELGDFGLFEGVSRLSVNMQFEAGGLRAVARWLWSGK